MKALRLIGSLAFVLGLFTAIFVGIPWYLSQDPMLPLWLKIAVYGIMGGILVILLTVAAERQKGGALGGGAPIRGVPASDVGSKFCGSPRS